MKPISILLTQPRGAGWEETRTSSLPLVNPSNIETSSTSVWPVDGGRIVTRGRSLLILLFPDPDTRRP